MGLGELREAEDPATAEIVQSAAPADHVEISFQTHPEVVAVPVHHQVGKGIDGDVLRGVGIMHKAVDKENQPAKQLLHDLLEGALIAVQKTAVAVGSGVHVLSSFGKKGPRGSLSFIIRSRGSQFLIFYKNRL